jgi:hypothetical protein
MPRKNTSRGDYYREKAREAEDEFFDAPEEYRSNFKNTQEEARKNKEKAPFDADEPTSGRGKIVAITLVGVVAILAVLLAAYYLLMNQGKVPEVGPLTTTSTTALTTVAPSAIDDSTELDDQGNVVINGTTRGSGSNGGGSNGSGSGQGATGKTNNYSNKMTANQVSSMVQRVGKKNGQVLIWDNIVEDDSDLTQYNYKYYAAYYRVTSEDQDIHAIEKNTVYIFLEATNKDPEQEEKGMLVLHAENVFKDGDQLNAEYIEGEMDRYTDASSFVSNYMAGKSGFQKVS